MYTVLVPVDDEQSRVEAQIEAVVGLPRATEDVRVELFHVRKELEFAEDDSEVRIGEILTDVGDADLEELPDTVAYARDELEAAGVEATVNAATGNPAAAILDVAERWDADEIVLGVRGQSPVGKVLFGSVTQSVILDTERAVKVVPA